MKEVSGVTCDSSSYVKEFKKSRGDESVGSWNVLKRTPLGAADKTYMDRITAQPQIDKNCFGWEVFLPPPLCLFALNHGKSCKPYILQHYITVRQRHPCQTWYPLLAPASKYQGDLAQAYFQLPDICNHSHNILRIMVLYQMFLSPLVKRSVINKVYSSSLRSCQMT